MNQLPVDIISICWKFFRVTFRSFAEGAFIYLLLSTNINNSKAPQKVTPFNKKKMFIFASICSLMAIPLSAFLDTGGIYRLVLSVLIFFYFWHKQQKNHKNLIINYNGMQDMRYALTTAIILALAVHSFNSISHMLLHTTFVLTGIYDAVCSVGIYYELYKTATMLIDILLMFVVYKLNFIRMKDIKTMSAYKWVPASFGFCFISMVYIGYTYYIFGDIPLTINYRNTLLWTMALMLPTYIGFYLTTTNLTRLLSLKENYAADENIFIWICNPSIIETNHLDIYDSNIFMANFESRKLDFKMKLKKLGINNEYKGYSELIFCLILTKLFMGLKGWSFERDVFLQAALVIDIPLPKLRKDIENIITQVWLTNEAETLINGYYLPCHNSNTYDQKKQPNVEEFLMNIAKSI